MFSDSDISRNTIPEPTLRRLPWYLSRLSVLRGEGVEHVSSTQLGRDLHLDSSVIAKDLSFINIKGKTRIGYDVESLENYLRKFLGFEHLHRAVIVGVGSLGEALIRDHGLGNFGLHIVAGFDVREEIIGININSTKIYSADSIARQVPKLKVDIGIVTVPVEVAQTTAEKLIEAGIKAIWNFAPLPLRVPKDVVIQNTSIYAPLAIMYNRLGKTEG